MLTWTPERCRTRGAKRKFRESIVSEYKGREQRLVKQTDVDGRVYHYEGAKGQERLVKRTHIGFVTRYAGAKGQESRVHMVTSGGNAIDFKGPKGNEYVVCMTWRDDGVAKHYDMINGEHIHLRDVYPDGAVLYYRSVKGQKGKKFHVTKSHKVLPDNRVIRYEGDVPFHERKVRIEVPPEATDSPKVLFPYGFVEHYEGERFHERLVCREIPRDEGTDWMYYEGPKGNEKAVRVKKPNGNISYYDDNGEHDYTEWPNGKKAYYRGGVASRLWIVNLDDRTDFFEDSDTELDDNDPDAPWNVREDCFSNVRRHETQFYNGDKFVYCPDNGDRITHIYRKAMGCWLPRSQVLWYRVREWFRKRAIVLHWQEQTQIRLYGPGGGGRLADRVAFVTDFVSP